MPQASWNGEIRKNLIAASLFGRVLGGLAMPALHGPIHFQVTKPFSMHGTLVPNAKTSSASVALGRVPMDFVITDVVVAGQHGGDVYITANSVRIANLRVNSNGTFYVESLHLNTGIPVPGGTVLGIESTLYTGSEPVTVCGYVQ